MYIYIYIQFNLFSGDSLPLCPVIHATLQPPAKCIQNRPVDGRIGTTLDARRPLESIQLPLGSGFSTSCLVEHNLHSTCFLKSASRCFSLWKYISHRCMDLS